MRSIRQLLTLQLLVAGALTCLALWVGSISVGAARATIGLPATLALAGLLASATALLHYLFGDGLKNACRTGLLCYASVLAVYCLSFLIWPNWLEGFSSHVEFVDFSGEKANRALVSAWPPSVRPDEVKRVSYKHQSSRDSYSSWYRIELTSDAARRWMDRIHAGKERASSASINQAERVHRTVVGPLPLRRQTGTTPAWWSPPSIEFRATEAMLWYKENDSGVAHATYSAFDPSVGTLWIYQYAAQQDHLWSRGAAPKNSKCRHRFPRSYPRTV
jgi:hypothetical protein